MADAPLPRNPIVHSSSTQRLDQLSDRLRLGDERALGELLELYWAPLLSYACRFTDGKDAAEDLVQEGFVRLWQRRDTAVAGSALQAYLYTTVRNLALNERRRSGVRIRFARLMSVDSGGASSNPFDVVAAGEAERASRAAIEALPNRRREIFELVRYHGLSYQEVAEVLNLSPQTVANQMSSALSHLRRHLRSFLGAE